MRKNRRGMPGKKEPEKTYPSNYGSHSSMIDEQKTKELEALHGDNKRVVIEDERGQYITYRSRLDSGLADPKRYTSRR
jgi:hypothetical protein